MPKVENGLSRKLTITVAVFRKKEDYVKELEESGKDQWMADALSIVDNVKNDVRNIYERRKHIEGFGIILAEGGFHNILREAMYAYELGLFHSTIALCGTVIERICYDRLDSHSYSLDGTASYDYEGGWDAMVKHGEAVRKALLSVPFRALVTFMKEINPNLDDKTESMMHEIYDIRNRYVHPTKKLNPKTDADRIINLTCNVTERLCGMNHRMAIKNGKIVRSDEFKQYLKEEAEEMKRERAAKKARKGLAK